ncbi:hypothetical protein AS156_19280 [Bradyrhizobium macuxiense]|uniref:DUF2380 domain-containing protein n=1 Tax=Bradyrhizobium macuxiense TaxID=1755647 RepID=A0A120FIM7_9BRAD|nr:DUF3280 domain-containing protein [Bradyrhizobium macuxiense]KWV47782.1 hypothetical protein AS156_19280 [Bradyrhizobium macuxiense]
MPRSRPALQTLVLAGFLFGFSHACPGALAAGRVGVEIQDFGYIDTSGEPTDQTASHQERLTAFTAALKRDVAADPLYRLVPSSCGSTCEADAPLTAERLHAASQGGANILIVGLVQKMSTLVQWARVRAVDLDGNRILFEKLYTFRGDNDGAWQRAEAFVSREIREALSTRQQAASAPVKLASFNFELEDGSAASAETTTDNAELANTTVAVRQMLGQSGRYVVIPVDGTKTDAAVPGAIHDCGGCDAGIARKLGADQSLIGVIVRISRMEYLVRFQLRDAGTGNVVASGSSGLRMGANYSWSRGATRLIRDRLLEPAQATELTPAPGAPVAPASR